MPTLEQLLEKYPDQVKIVFKQFPLKSHRHAKQAAAATIAAEAQGKFWDFHDRLFENYNKLDDKKIRAIAVELGLDMAAFDGSLAHPATNATIQKDLSDGVKAGVRGTPAVFLNGKRTDRRSLKDFTRAVEKELAKLKSMAEK